MKDGPLSVIMCSGDIKDEGTERSLDLTREDQGQFKKALPNLKK